MYPPREDTELLLPFAEVAPGVRVVEIGCGSGEASLKAARAGGRVVATDLNPHALRSLRARARAEGLPVETVRTDLAAGLRRFDRILANPPYLPTAPSARDPERWVNAALDGGPDGWSVSARILQSLPDHLRRGGVAYLIVSSRQSTERRRSLARVWRASSGRLRVAATRRVGAERLWVWELRLRPAGAKDPRRRR